MKSYILTLFLFCILFSPDVFPNISTCPEDSIEIIQIDTINHSGFKNKIVFVSGIGIPGTAFWYAPNRTFEFFGSSIGSPLMYTEKTVYGNNIPVYGKLLIQLHPHHEFGIHFYYSNYSFENNSNIGGSELYSFLMRFNWHRDIKNKVDIYWGFGLGYRFGQTFLIDKNNNFQEDRNTYKSLSFEYTTGARFNLYENTGIYIELGWARALIQAGIFYQIRY